MAINSDITRYHGAFAGADAFVIASGPSSGLVDADKVRQFGLDKITIGANDVWRVLNGEPMDFDFFVILDRKFYEDHWKDIAQYRMHRDRTMPITFFELDTPHVRIPIDMNWDAQLAESRDEIRGGFDPDRYFHGHSSGVAGVQFAMHIGCKRIFLLGHDLTVTPNRSHGFGSRHSELQNGYRQGLTMRSGYALLAKHAEQLGIEIINLSPISTIEQFPIKPEILL